MPFFLGLSLHSIQCQPGGMRFPNPLDFPWPHPAKLPPSAGISQLQPPWACIADFLKRLSRNSRQTQELSDKHRQRINGMALGEEPFFLSAQPAQFPHSIHRMTCSSPTLLTHGSPTLQAHTLERSLLAAACGAAFLGRLSRRSGLTKGVSKIHRERLSCVALGQRPLFPAYPN